MAWMFRWEFSMLTFWLSNLREFAVKLTNCIEWESPSKGEKPMGQSLDLIEPLIFSSGVTCVWCVMIRYRCSFNLWRCRRDRCRRLGFDRSKSKIVWFCSRCFFRAFRMVQKRINLVEQATNRPAGLWIFLTNDNVHCRIWGRMGWRCGGGLCSLGGPSWKAIHHPFLQKFVQLPLAKIKYPRKRCRKFGVDFWMHANILAQEGVTSMVATANRGGARISDEAFENIAVWYFGGEIGKTNEFYCRFMRVNRDLFRRSVETLLSTRLSHLKHDLFSQVLLNHELLQYSRQVGGIQAVDFGGNYGSESESI